MLGIQFSVCIMIVNFIHGAVMGVTIGVCCYLCSMWCNLIGNLRSCAGWKTPCTKGPYIKHSQAEMLEVTKSMGI